MGGESGQTHAERKSENDRKRAGEAATHIEKRDEEVEARDSGHGLVEDTCGQRADANNRSRALHLVLSCRERWQKTSRVGRPGPRRRCRLLSCACEARSDMCPTSHDGVLLGKGASGAAAASRELDSRAVDSGTKRLQIATGGRTVEQSGQV